MIRSRWIRPEDIKYYEEIGINRFKIAGRNKKTEWILNVVKAFAERRYEGDLLDLVSYPQGRAATKAIQMVNGPSSYSVLTKVKIDNTKFPEGWIKFFLTNDCDTRSCKECKYRDIVAERVITIDGEPFKTDKWNIRQSYPINLIPKFKENGIKKGNQ